MAILRIESVTYGVDDLELCRQFFTDAGLEPVAAGDGDSVSLRTPANQYVRLKSIDDPALPAAVQDGPTVREIVWGVDSKDSLNRIKAGLEACGSVSVDADGIVHSTDRTGFGIGFVIADPASVDIARRRYNVSGSVERVNEDVVPYGRARPLRIIHVALNIPKEGREDANAFYTDALRFKAIDTVAPMGTFMQCEGDIEHHNFLLCHRPDRAGINHIAFEVRDIDEVVEGGNYMNARGWKESRRFGRHNLGSNVFRMFHAPCGGRIEFAADMDRMDKSFEPRYWEETPPHNHWMLKSPPGGDD